MRKALFAAFCLILLTNCSKPRATRIGATPSNNNSSNNSSQEPAPSSTNSEEAKTYLALGDSYTYGESVLEKQRLPEQITFQLNGLEVRTNSAEVIAQSGWTTGDLLSKLNSEPPKQSKYTFVTLLIGVNNQYQGRSQEEYRDQFSMLVDKAIQYTGNYSNRVFVLSIPDWSVMPFANGSNKERISKQIDSFNIINKQISALKKVRYTDVTDFSRLAATDPNLIASDGLHPSGEQYRMWANRLVTTIRATFY